MGQILTIEEMQELARTKGGECLSTRYINAVTKLRWKCAKGHEWEAQPNMVKNDGTWCPFCSGKVKHTIEAMRELAKSRGGECLSNHYVNVFDKLRWCCAKGHEWNASASSIKNHRSWCPICAPDVVSKKLSLDIEEMRSLAKSRGGDCLSETYPKRHGEKLLWRCRDGHEWESTPASVKHANQWCPICSSGLSERLCRALFEKIFEEKFPKARPSWLTNSRGNRMELDGFCEKLSLAFEYQGVQHYEEKKFFDRKKALAVRIEDDNRKRSLCKINCISLIEVPYSIQPKNLQKFIYEQCKKLGLTVKRKAAINLADLDYYPKHRLEEMRAHAKSRGGECLADRYVTVITPVMWRCKKGHEWKVAFHYIKNKRQWCPTCAGNIKLSIEDMQELAKIKGGFCLSKKYHNLNEKLLWLCAEGHKWRATANDIRNSGSWCPTCAGVARLDIKKMQNIARERGGKCLSKKYINNKTKLLWCCAKGHEWKAAAQDICNAGHWCPYCAGKAKLTIEEMRLIALSRGGKCLSRQYVNGSTKLLWRCKLGHEWTATPDNVKNGNSWCPICYNTARKYR